MFRIHAFAAFALAIATTFAPAAAEPAAPAENPPGPDQIARWVSDLHSDRFHVREEATGNLVKAGRPAIGPVAAAIGPGGPEVTARAIHILKELVLSSDAPTEAAAWKALEGIAGGSNRVAAERASEVLTHLGVMRRDRAVAELRRLGAKVTASQFTEVRGGQLTVVQDVFAVEIGRDWAGGEKGLAHLKWLSSLRQVTFDGPQVTDAWLGPLHSLSQLQVLFIKRAKVGDAGLARLKDLPNLQSLSFYYTPITDKGAELLQTLPAVVQVQLFGTKITHDGARHIREAMAKARPGVPINVDLRAGGFLGVGCQSPNNPRLVTRVQPGSAAARAGFQTGDVIVQYNGKDVADFHVLTALIAENAPGDKVSVKILRGGRPITKEIVLGQWE